MKKLVVAIITVVFVLGCMSGCGSATAKKVVDNKAAELNEMKTVFTKLQEATHKLSSEMYKQGSTAGGAQGPNSGAAGSGEAADASSAKKDGDDVIDADYKDVN